VSDFVWAVRLAKVHKGLLMRDWSLGPYTQLATFGADEEEVDVAGTVAAEGLDKFLVVEDEKLGEAFVVEKEDKNEQRGGHEMGAGGISAQ
jgi:hypothetical protein